MGSITVGGWYPISSHGNNRHPRWVGVSWCSKLTTSVMRSFWWNCNFVLSVWELLAHELAGMFLVLVEHSSLFGLVYSNSPIPLPSIMQVILIFLYSNWVEVACLFLWPWSKFTPQSSIHVCYICFLYLFTLGKRSLLVSTVTWLTSRHLKSGDDLWSHPQFVVSVKTKTI